ncbi:MAG: hypothetical protein EZS28_018884 [Streblomastix strix]|uniref:Uncharacterized protein n=1 Tax=Streblomastix strix TaxID=222440 RepID=A0A5J4VT27_9EUKA|nr:MAG: hypothetical protein EZS28_018884 [Streblomastix strix]
MVHRQLRTLTKISVFHLHCVLCSLFYICCQCSCGYLSTIKIPKVLAGITVVQLIQQVQTQQRVALPLAPNGAGVYLVPPEVKVFLGQSKNSYLDSVNDQDSIVKVLSTSFIAEYDETQSECEAFDNRDKQSDALNDIY